MGDNVLSLIDEPWRKHRDPVSLPTYSRVVSEHRKTGRRSSTAEKEIEIVTLAPSGDAQKASADSPGDKGDAKAKRHRIAARAAKEINDGYHVNLGVGIPVLVAEHLKPGVRVWLQSENGILGKLNSFLVRIRFVK